jgi:multidrug efflux pump subunit AcrA (membrane-fusion protein)
MADREAEEPEIIVTDEEGNPYTDDGFVVDHEAHDGPIIAGIDDPVGEITEEKRLAADDPLAVLQRNFDQLNAKFTETERQLGEAQTHADRAAKTEREAQKALLATGKATAAAELAEAKRVYAAALRDSKHDEAAEAQQAMISATADIRDFDAALAEVESAPAPEPRRKADPAPAGTPPVDAPYGQKVDYFIGTLGPKTQEFAKKYRDKIFIDGDGKPFQQVIALDQLARAKGIEPDTEAYFDLIESQMGWKGKDVKQPTANPRKPAPKMAAAPPNRGPSGSTTPNSVALSRDEVDAARRMGMKPADYARNKQRALQGAKDPNYRGPLYSKDNPANQGGR